MRYCALFLCMSVMIPTVSTYASESTTYGYDALGRLVSTSHAGGPRNGKTNAQDYDPVGNRTAIAVGQPLPPPVPNASLFSVSGPATVSEGNAAAFTVTRTGTASSVLSVNYATVNGTAVAPGDYSSAAGILTFLDWETAKTVTIAIADDGLGEPAESFSMQLSSPSSGASLGTASASAQIAASAPANQPPIANVNSLSVVACETGEVDVLANDTDPEGNYPLTLVSVGPSTIGSAYISGTKFGFSAGGAAGSQNVTYVVKDSLGASSTGIVVVHVRGVCL